MLESFNAARARRINGRRSRLEQNRLQAELGTFASDVDLARFDIEPSGQGPDQRTKELRELHQLLSLKVVNY
ncbi:hypothetical protein MLP_06870 [Microlunatus phosphovorus NM-1]|uniref:Uncharacterized protein n=1 Tax=Microlunatus phosphovorus (strain ATCC 700054 / DSM 10555 / JCM 9379 / NBRC 101784 / NCIMB 13414 / VKM Ac-1990 / NM-1) TaxID=1032480 RepID=F5XL13_MICPN|nr:hypothetical protein [Microlunatus phosphovorus]BAK33701.1 hypothetical protein MLP_06870 [Microlunatus phosphovorus NM-1]